MELEPFGSDNAALISETCFHFFLKDSNKDSNFIFEVCGNLGFVFKIWG
jgi:hypothetical protein